MKTYVFILAGGAGTRFWPASRENKPKQFLDMTGSGKSLLRQTVDRFLRFVPAGQIYVITHDAYAGLVHEHVPELTTSQVLLEPSRQNTAPAICYASMKLMALDPEGVCVVASADHLIEKEVEFERVIRLAVDHAASHPRLIALSIRPDRADTGYGYAEYDPSEESELRKVLSFKEKPDLRTAESYLRRQCFAWNAGIFIWSLRSILQAFQAHAPDLYHLFSQGQSVYNTPGEQAFLASHYGKAEKIAVDFAILERADNVWTITADLGWSDLGTWASLYVHSAKDASQNAVNARPSFVEDCSRSIIFSDPGKLVVLKGLDDFIIVDTEDCLLIYPKSEEQSIRELKEKLREKGLKGYL